MTAPDISSDLRLYLDTADLIAIADGKVDPAVLAELRAAVAETGAVLVVGVPLLWDFYQRSDKPTRERMIAAVNSFPVVGFVMLDPTTLESELTTETDISLAACADIRGVLEHPDTAASLRALDIVPSLARDAEQAAAEAKRVEDRPMRKADVEEYARLLIGFAEAAKGLDDDAVAALWSERTGQALSAELRTTAVSTIRVVEDLRKRIPGIDDDQLIDLVLGKESRDTAQVAPGTFVYRSLRDARRRNYTRNSLESDVVDLHHVQFLPYVDILTTDRQNVADLARLDGKFRKTRAGRLVRNARLGELPALLRAVAQERAEK